MIPTWRKLHKYRGLLIILIWQAPTPARPREDGSLQYGFGVGRASIEEFVYSGNGCAGEEVTRSFKKYQPVSVGATVTGWTSPNVRLGLGAAFTSADTSSLSGPQVTGMLAGEWKYFGIGGGFVLSPAESIPGLYLRAGPLDRLHLLLDVPSFSLPVPSTGPGRLGLAYNQGKAGGVGGFVGIPVCYVTCVYGGGGVRADVRIPVSKRVSFDVSAFRHAPEDSLSYWGIAAGGRIRR